MTSSRVLLSLKLRAAIPGQKPSYFPAHFFPMQNLQEVLQGVKLTPVDPSDVHDLSQPSIVRRRDDASLGTHSGSSAEMHGLGPVGLQHLKKIFMDNDAASLWEKADAEIFEKPTSDWQAPIKVLDDDRQSRPGYQGTQKHEYEDHPDVLHRKVKLLALMIRAAKAFIVYSGAGISTSSGIGDYATSDREGGPPSTTPRSHYDALPSYAHRAITGLFHAGHLKHWVQQNHDGLPQKAGFPQSHINEIHGAWYAPDNPVIPMSGNLRGDYFEWLLEWEKKTDLCLAVGTSLAGMNADRVVDNVAKRFRRGFCFGSVIINLQTTRMDSFATLRIFGRLDAVLELLARELALQVAVSLNK
jgi:NAD-dependent SIR2 family protein deacetylase